MSKSGTLVGQGAKGNPATSVATRQRTLSSNPRWTKLQTVSNQLEELALNLGPTTKLPRVTDLCVQFGASITTVNAALGELEARGVLQRRPGVGIFVASDLHRENILLLCNSNLLSRPDLSPFWSLLLQSVQERANTDSLGFDLHFADSTISSERGKLPTISKAVSRLIETDQVNGAISIDVSRETAEYIERHGIPVVAFAGPANYMVQIDLQGLIYQGVHALARTGAKRIGLWSPLQTYCDREAAYSFLRGTLNAFQQAMREVNLPVDMALVHQNQYRAPNPDSITETSYQEQGYETAMAVFGNNHTKIVPPDAVLSTDDMLTVGALSALRRCGVHVGGQTPRVLDTNGSAKSVIIATHANAGSPVLIGYEDALILTEVDPAEVVSALFTTLEALMAGEKPANNNIRIPGKLKMPVLSQSK